MIADHLSVSELGSGRKLLIARLKDPKFVENRYRKPPDDVEKVFFARIRKPPENAI